ncbi:hypothetical protein COU59_01715 [Candidatus Pacearchaeota archaeon CG10_big_fil_rev_8_21_14_0_10_34_12]|nr:MAG: hypothetical protein COU59_01715 [Candidatus Pacearchaeota archaeon CG10_big_fil_rev_8_21_14_0_10_34_12]
MHLKRQKAPKKWPIERKGTAYLAKPRFSNNEGIPVLFIIRNVLKLAQNRREVKALINSKKILINGKFLRDEKHTAMLFDVISMPSVKKYYAVNVSENGKIGVDEINEKDAGKKISKIMNKRLMKGKKMQINLGDGRNLLSDIKCKVNDSVLIDLKKEGVEKCIPLQEKANIVVFDGKHTGVKGKIKSIDRKEGIAKIMQGDKEINVLIKQMIVVE